MPMASTTPGTTIGVIRSARSSPLARLFMRSSPKAAMVPTTVATIAVTTATLSELKKLDDQSGLVKKFSYHIHEKPSGGKASDLFSLKDIGTTTNVGATSQMATRTQNRPSSRRRWQLHGPTDPVRCGWRISGMAMASSTKVATSSTTPIAPPRPQLSRLSTWVWIRVDSIVERGPPSSAGVM